MDIQQDVGGLLEALSNEVYLTREIRRLNAAAPQKEACPFINIIAH